jgi:hypothetical protein
VYVGKKVVEVKYRVTYNLTRAMIGNITSPVYGIINSLLLFQALFIKQ